LMLYANSDVFNEYKDYLLNVNNCKSCWFTVNIPLEDAKSNL
jgi:hypothetical protein